MPPFGEHTYKKKKKFLEIYRRESTPLKEISPKQNT